MEEVEEAKQAEQEEEDEEVKEGGLRRPGLIIPRLAQKEWVKLKCKSSKSGISGFKFRLW